MIDVTGSVLADDTGPVEEVGLLRTQSLGEVCRHRPVGITVYQKVMCADDLIPRPIGGGGEDR